MSSDRPGIGKKSEKEAGDAEPSSEGSPLPSRDQPRRFPRFNMIASAKAFVPGGDPALHILSVKDVGRGGLALFTRENIPVGSDINVSLYSKIADRVVAAESIQGGIVSVVPWKDSIYLLNIRFHQPISPEHQLNFHQYLLSLESAS